MYDRVYGYGTQSITDKVSLSPVIRALYFGLSMLFVAVDNDNNNNRFFFNLSSLRRLLRVRPGLPKASRRDLLGDR